MVNIDDEMILAVAGKLQPLFNAKVSADIARELLEAALAGWVVISKSDAARVCKRLEHDASWDKCGDGYYSMKRQVNEAADAREERE